MWLRSRQSRTASGWKRNTSASVLVVASSHSAASSQTKPSWRASSARSSSAGRRSKRPSASQCGSLLAPHIQLRRRNQTSRPAPTTIMSAQTAG